MPQKNATLKAANLTTIGTLPIPQFQPPSVPDKIRRIDEAGWDAWEAEFNRRLQVWFTGVNTQFQAQGQSLSTLIKKP